MNDAFAYDGTQPPVHIIQRDSQLPKLMAGWGPLFFYQSHPDTKRLFSSRQDTTLLLLQVQLNTRLNLRLIGDMVFLMLAHEEFTPF